MKTAINTKSARRRHFPSLALLLAAVTLLAFAPQPVRAGPSYPFHARFITEFEIVVELPYVHYTVNCQGRATYMGPTTAVSTDQVVNMHRPQCDRNLHADFRRGWSPRRHAHPGDDLSGDRRAWRDHLHRQLHGRRRDRSLRWGNGKRRCGGIGAPRRANKHWHRLVLALRRNLLRTGGLKQTGNDLGPSSIPGPGSGQDTLTLTRT